MPTHITFDWHEIADLKNTKNLPEKQQKTDEGKLILAAISASDTLILFDEKGSPHTSKGFAQFLQKKMNAGTKKLVFVIGGPYGFSQEVYARAQGKIALSQMTFSQYVSHNIHSSTQYSRLSFIFLQ